MVHLSTRGKVHMAGVSEAARNLAREIERANRGNDVVIVKNNKPQAVLIGVEEYNRLQDAAEMLERVQIAKLIDARRDASPAEDMTLDDLAKRHGL